MYSWQSSESSQDARDDNESRLNGEESSGSAPDRREVELSIRALTDSTEDLARKTPESEGKREDASHNTNLRKLSSAEEDKTPHIRSTSHRDTHSHESSRAHPHYPPSPPPIANVPQSPALSVSSLDRSSASTPNTLPRSPPHEPYNMHTLYPQNQYPQPLRMHYSNAYPPMSSSYSYSNDPAFDHRYAHTSPNQNQTHQVAPLYPTHLPPVNAPPTQPRHSLHAYSFASPSVVFTDDAATKLSDRVRRRCFNCCTTDTSTWRRSNLNPGKVLCNKCGLFERTHSRPRPEQFARKGGPLATSTMRQSPQAAAHSTSPPGYGLPLVSYSYPQSAGPAAHPSKEFHSNHLPDIKTWTHEQNATDGPSHPPSAAKHMFEHNGHGGGSGSSGSGSGSGAVHVQRPHSPSPKSPPPLASHQ